MPGMRKKDEVSQDNNQREEDYQKLFPKIGRDFVSREDLTAILDIIADALPGVSLDIGTSKAVALATEYKDNLEKGESERKKYKDLVELDEEQEENDEETDE